MPAPSMASKTRKTRKRRALEKVKRPARVPAPKFPKSVERRYRAYLLRRVKALDKLVKLHVLKSLATGKGTGKITAPANVRADGLVADILAKLRKAWASQAPPDPALLIRFVDQIAASARAFQARLVVGPLPLPVPFSTKGFVAENVKLIKSIDAVYLDRVATIVAEAQSKGWSASRAGRELRDATGITTRRAQLIARDQIATVNSKIAEKQQTAVGIDSYIWSTSQDERVRPDHAAREGKEFKWSEPPFDGNPGEPINCRCVAIPVFPSTT